MAVNRARIINFNFFIKTIGASNTSEALNATSIYTTEFELYFPTGNAAVVYFGASNISANAIPRTAGSIVAFNAENIMGEPRHFNLNEIYVYGTAGDTVRVQYRTIDSGL